MKKLLLASVLAIASFPGYARADNVREEWKAQCAKGDQDACRELCHEPEDNCDAEGNPPARVTLPTKALRLSDGSTSHTRSVVIHPAVPWAL